jgi:hypothetical protein
MVMGSVVRIDQEIAVICRRLSDSYSACVAITDPKDAVPLDNLINGCLGADYYESIRYTSEDLARLRSATLFARVYNVTIFTMRRDEVLKICPSATRD